MVLLEGYDLGELVNERKSTILSHYLTKALRRAACRDNTTSTRR